MSFAYPLLLVIFLIPALLILFSHRRLAIKVPSLIDSSFSLSLRATLREPVLKLFLFLTVTTLAFGAARPLVFEYQKNTIPKRNLMLCIDLSKSMLSNDFISSRYRLSRIEGLKEVLIQFVDRRISDRIGIIAFGDEAHPILPLTNHTDLVKRAVQALQVGIVGEATALGDGIAQALKRITSVTSESKAIILITDGVKTAGQVDPLQASKQAEKLGVKIYTIGIGRKNSNPGLDYNNIFSGSNAEFDEALLIDIAKTTGGEYFHAEDREGLIQISDKIDELETAIQEEESLIINQDLSYLFAYAAFGFLASYILLSSFFLRGLP